MSDPSPVTVFDSDQARSLASDLLNIGAVALRPCDPFEWASGRVAPIYCDNRRTLAHPTVRGDIADGFVSLIRKRDLMPVTIAGTATAGIPHAAWLSDRLAAPMAYVRSESKAHGTQNRIEGAQLGPKDDVVVVEDLISTGKSVLDVVDVLRGAGASVLGVLAVFTYDLDISKAAFRDAGIPCSVLTNFPTLVEVGNRTGDLADEDLTTLREWREDPVAWSLNHGGVGAR